MEGKLLGQEEVSFQATEATCRLDSGQVLVGTRPGRGRVPEDRQTGRGAGGLESKTAEADMMERGWSPQVCAPCRGSCPAAHPLHLPHPHLATGRLQTRQCGSVVPQR